MNNNLELQTGRYISQLEKENKQLKKELDRLKEELKIKHLKIMRLNSKVTLLHKGF